MRYHFAWQLTEHDRRQLERLSRRYGFTILEIVQMMNEIILSEIDPAPGEGTACTLSRPSGVLDFDYFAKANVPEPNADVSLFAAWDHAVHDAEVTRCLLNSGPPIATVIAAWENMIAWFRFWAVRHPSAEWRAWNKSMLEESEARMARIVAKRRPAVIDGSGRCLH